MISTHFRIPIAIVALLTFAGSSDADLVHQWKFNGYATDAVGLAHGMLGGGASIVGDRLSLDGIDGQVLTRPLDTTLTEKTLISWVSLNDLNQPGGGSALSVQIGGGAGGAGFDGIVYGERVPGQWMNGSNNWFRTVPDNGGIAETVMEPDEVMMAITYAADNSITIFRNGVEYASAANASQGELNTYEGGMADAIFGRRHDGAGNPLNAFINEARIYNEVLSPTAIGDLFTAGPDLSPSDPPPLPPPPGLLHLWTFEDGTANDMIGSAHGTLYNGAEVVDGRLQLDGIDDYLRSDPIDGDVSAKTLLAWVSLDNLQRSAGGLLTLENPIGPDVFDSIVFGERLAGQWMAGSNFFQRTVADNGGAPETVTEDMVVEPKDHVMVAIVYDDDNSITLYRNGVEYASAANASQGALQTYLGGNADVVMGVRHSDIADGTGTVDGNDPFLAGWIEEARVYNYALSATEISDVFEVGPVPEPATLGPALLGMLAALGLARRNRPRRPA